MKHEKVLLVDNEEIILETVGDDLREAGFTVVQANNGAEGIRQFKVEKFDLVISDLMMGDHDGFEVSREIKRISPETPVVIHYRLSFSKSRQRSSYSGSQRYHHETLRFGGDF